MIGQSLKRLIVFIQNNATGKVVLSFFIPAMIVYAIMLLYTVPRVVQYAPEMKLFDLLPTGYSYQYAIDLLSTLGEKGRHLYLYQQLPLDFIYPSLFAMSCCLLLSWLFAKSLDLNSKVYYLCFIPVSAGFFDYLENIYVVKMLVTYPNVLEKNVSIASLMTILKSGFTSAFFVVMLIGIILFANHKSTHIH